MNSSTNHSANHTSMYPFDHVDAQHIHLTGGKGAGLARAVAAGLPVPDGVVIPTTVYQEWFAPFAEQVQTVLNRNVSDQEKSERIQTLLLGNPLPEALVDALSVYIAKHPKRYYAVRSSGSLEDLPGAAFAGLHDTLLNVHGLDALCTAILQCYVSLWNAHVLPYRARLGVDHQAAAMAVVVQTMMNVGQHDAAGVAFSIDPVGDDLSLVLVNSAFGLGETVVGGEEPVDEFRVDCSGACLSQTIACKTKALVRATGVSDEADSSGTTLTQEIHLPSAQQNQSSITDSQVADIAALARLAELHFEFPQDIEWAYEGDALYLLQSRPITRFAAKWTRDESAERFPNPVTPLTWDLCEAGFHRSLNYSFELMGLPHFNDKWFAVKDHYVYGNQHAVEVYSGRLPLAALRDLDSLRVYLNEHGLSRYQWITELPSIWVKDLDGYLIAIGRFEQTDLSQKSLAECWQHLLEINTLGTNYFLPNIAISLTQRLLYGILKQMLLHIVGAERAQHAFDDLIAVTETKTGLVNAELWNLAQTMAQHDALCHADIAIDGSNLDDILSLDTNFAAQFTQFLQQHGHREVDFDAYHPTWLETPQTVLTQIQVLAQHQDADDTAHDAWSKKQRMATVEHQVLTECPDDMRFFVQELIRLTRTYTALDDIEHYQTTRLTIPFRRAARAIGERLVNMGSLNAAMDVFFCSRAVLEQAIETDDYTAIRSNVETNKVGYEQACMQAAPWVYGAAAQDEEEGLGDDGSGWKGLAGSPGTVEGEVFVIHSHEQFGDFPKNAILVARTTNPAWTPLFYHASGVITESGGPLSHGAVTARELGIPAVMSIRDACQRLQSGDRVRLDGQKGMVTVL